MNVYAPNNEVISTIYNVISLLEILSEKSERLVEIQRSHQSMSYEGMETISLKTDLKTFHRPLQEELYKLTSLLSLNIPQVIEVDRLNYTMLLSYIVQYLSYVNDYKEAYSTYEPSNDIHALTLSINAVIDNIELELNK